MTRKFFLKRLYEIPTATGIGVGISLLTIGAPMFIIEILGPNYNIDANDLILRWGVICVVITHVYFWRKALISQNK